MRFDTQFTVVEAALKGYNKWVSTLGSRPQEDVGHPRLVNISEAKRQ